MFYLQVTGLDPLPVVAKCHHQQTVVYGLMRNGFAYLLQCVAELPSTSPMTFPTALEIQQKANGNPSLHSA